MCVLNGINLYTVKKTEREKEQALLASLLEPLPTEIPTGDMLTSEEADDIDKEGSVAARAATASPLLALLSLGFQAPYMYIMCCMKSNWVK